MKRAGKTLKTLPDGDRRRLADARNAIRKMNAEQIEMLAGFIVEHRPDLAAAVRTADTD